MNATEELGQLLGSLGVAVERGAGPDPSVPRSHPPAGGPKHHGGGLLLATPMILRHPFFRTPLGRAIELGGAAALIAKGATVIRDWEPGPAARGRRLRTS